MNFDPKTKAWLTLVSLLVGTAAGVGYTAFLSGASWQGATICGLGSGFMSLYHALADSPLEKAAKAATVSPFPPKSP